MKYIFRINSRGKAANYIEVVRAQEKIDLLLNLFEEQTKLYAVPIISVEDKDDTKL